MGDPLQRLMELDARHTELLERLDELDLQVCAVLDEWIKSKESPRNESEPSANAEILELIDQEQSENSDVSEPEIRSAA